MGLFDEVTDLVDSSTRTIRRRSRRRGARVSPPRPRSEGAPKNSAEWRKRAAKRKRDKYRKGTGNKDVDRLGREGMELTRRIGKGLSNFDAPEPDSWWGGPLDEFRRAGKQLKDTFIDEGPGNEWRAAKGSAKALWEAGGFLGDDVRKLQASLPLGGLNRYARTKKGRAALRRGWYADDFAIETIKNTPKEALNTAPGMLGRSAYNLASGHPDEALHWLKEASKRVKERPLTSTVELWAAVRMPSAAVGKGAAMSAKRGWRKGARKPRMERIAGLEPKGGMAGPTAASPALVNTGLRPKTFEVKAFDTDHSFTKSVRRDPLGRDIQLKGEAWIHRAGEGKGRGAALARGYQNRRVATRSRIRGMREVTRQQLRDQKALIDARRALSYMENKAAFIAASGLTAGQMREINQRMFWRFEDELRRRHGQPPRRPPGADPRPAGPKPPQPKGGPSSAMPIEEARARWAAMKPDTGDVPEQMLFRDVPHTRDGGLPQTWLAGDRTPRERPPGVQPGIEFWGVKPTEDLIPDTPEEFFRRIARDEAGDPGPLNEPPRQSPPPPPDAPDTPDTPDGHDEIDDLVFNSSDEELKVYMHNHLERIKLIDEVADSGVLDNPSPRLLRYIEAAAKLDDVDINRMADLGGNLEELLARRASEGLVAQKLGIVDEAPLGHVARPHDYSFFARKTKTGKRSMRYTRGKLPEQVTHDNLRAFLTASDDIDLHNSLLRRNNMVADYDARLKRHDWLLEHGKRVNQVEAIRLEEQGWKRAEGKLSILAQDLRETLLRAESLQDVPGYERIVKQLEDLAPDDDTVVMLPASVHDELVGEYRAASRFQRRFERVMDSGNAAWKLAVLHSRPAWVVNNFLGQMTLLARGKGVKGLASWAALTQEELAEGISRHVLRRDQPLNTTARRLREEFGDVVETGARREMVGDETLGLWAGGGEKLVDVRHPLQSAARFAHQPVRNTGRMLTRGGMAMGRANARLTDDLPRLAHIHAQMAPDIRELRRLNPGMSEEQAFRALVSDPDYRQRIVDKALDDLVDFDNMSNFERGVMRRYVDPFYSWTKGSLKVFAKMAIEDPWQLALLLNMGEREIAEMEAKYGDKWPAHLLGMIITGKTGDGEWIEGYSTNAAWWMNTPAEKIKTISGLFGKNEGDEQTNPVSGVHPLINAAMEAANRRDSFTGQSLDPDDNRSAAGIFLDELTDVPARQLAERYLTDAGKNTDKNLVDRDPELAAWNYLGNPKRRVRNPELPRTVGEFEQRIAETKDVDWVRRQLDHDSETVRKAAMRRLGVSPELWASAEELKDLIAVTDDVELLHRLTYDKRSGVRKAAYKRLGLDPDTGRPVEAEDEWGSSSDDGWNSNPTLDDWGSSDDDGWGSSTSSYDGW